MVLLKGGIAAARPGQATPVRDLQHEAPEAAGRLGSRSLPRYPWVRALDAVEELVRACPAGS